MQVALHVARIWAVNVLGTLLVIAAFGWILAVVDADWRDRLTGDVQTVEVTVVGQQRNEFGCGSKYKSPGWDWKVTYTDGGRERTGALVKCDQAPPVGTRVRTQVTDNGTLGGETTSNYYLWWPIVSIVLGSGLAWIWLAGRGKPALQAVRAEQNGA
ncbi:hypothetical protein ABIE44_000991 [Marmoricola sp. OAE513]|uniref:hypothetical protein n=1 Tax=Marmoricola sp. OAE513 TaxID=2817894 RepID=UPI001AEB9259